ncbi:MAG: HYR domain-containing protein, partial [Deltaproteobacteria bacterium]|nr:HYR domain-containing protein [Deltaproteobacteria bacterium]
MKRFLLSLLTVFFCMVAAGAANAGWQARTAMPLARSSTVAGVIGNVIYAAGGINGTDKADLQAYDAAADAWTQLAPMPAGRYGGAGGVINGILYVAGGWDNSYSWLPHNGLYAYNPATNTWATLANMPTLSACGAAGAINGKLYVTTPCNGYSGWTRFLHVYDPVTNAWTALASLPITHMGAASGVVNGKFYVAGGFDDAALAYTNQLDVYDPAADTWTTLAPMPAVVIGGAGAVMDNRLYVMGGSDGAGTVFNTVYAYDPATDSWTAADPMPAARVNAAAGSVGGSAYVIGGVDSTGTVVLSTVERFTPSAPQLSSAVFFGGAADDEQGTSVAIAGGSLYLSGSTSANGTDGVVAQYALPLASGASPAWSAAWPGVAGPDNFYGVALTSEGAYLAGDGYSQTTDGVGGKEGKAVLAKFPLSGAATPVLVAKPNFFPYTGGETFLAAAAAVENGTPYVYAAGGAQPCSYSAFVVAKYDASGNLIARATDSTAGIAFNTCVGGYDKSSAAFGLTVLNGNVYAAGYSTYPDALDRPAIYKHDANLNLTWRRAETLAAGAGGQLQGIAALGNDLYAVGYSYTPGVQGSEDYLIEKYDEAGALAWSRTYGGTASDVLKGVAAVGGRLFAVGYTRSQGAGGADAVVLEIDPATGDTLSTTLYGGAQDDMANGAATDGTDLYVAGETRSFGSGGNDAMILRYVLSIQPGQPGDSTPPVIYGATNRTVPATGASGAVVTYTVTANDAVSGAVAVTCSPASGSTFAIGTTTVNCSATDGANNTATASFNVTVTPPPDTTPPTGTVAVNSGAASTMWLGVTLTLSASDNSGSVAQMRFSNDGVTWSNWEAYSTTKAWALALGPSGVRTAYAQFKDTDGNASTTSDVIFYDSTPPTGTVVINSGAASTASASVTLTIAATDNVGVAQMRFSNDNAAWSAWQAYSTTKAWTLASGFGAKTVYAQFRDGAGNISANAVDAIFLDNTPPTGTVVINSGAASTTSSGVALTLSATDDSGRVASMRLSNDNATWSAWQAYATGKSWTLASGTGTRTVYAQFRDGAGNVSATASDTIVVAKTEFVLSVLNAQASAVSGTVITVANTVVNAGNSASPATTVNFYISSDAAISSDDALIGSRTVGLLAGGATSAASTALNVPVYVTPGAYYICAFVDPNGLVDEVNKVNNKRCTATTIAVTSGVDLALTGLSAPASAQRGTVIGVTDTLRNNGVGASGVSHTKYYLSTDAVLSAGDIYLGERLAGIIAALGASSATTS